VRHKLTAVNGCNNCDPSLIKLQNPTNENRSNRKLNVDNNTKEQFHVLKMSLQLFHKKKRASKKTGSFLPHKRIAVSRTTPQSSYVPVLRNTDNSYRK
jgi:hypothetical protein